MRSRVARPFRLPRAAGLAILLVAACGRGGTPEKAPDTGPVRGGALVASIRSEPGTFNRFGPRGNSTPTDVIARLTQAPLVRINRVTGDAEPWLADHWTTSPDGRTMTVTLRDAGRAEYLSATDEEALAAFCRLAETEGIIPALEPAHALARAGELEGDLVLVCLSGRGDKDLDQALELLGRT